MIKLFICGLVSLSVSISFASSKENKPELPKEIELYMAYEAEDICYERYIAENLKEQLYEGRGQGWSEKNNDLIQDDGYQVEFGQIYLDKLKDKPWLYGPAKGIKDSGISHQIPNPRLTFS
jgi:hypothetical protein